MTRTAPNSIGTMREATRRQVLLATATGAAMAATAPFGLKFARAQEPIRIGFSMALTGGLAGAGKPALIAMEIWREDINAKGGLLGRPVEFVYYDDQTTARERAEDLHQAVERRQRRPGRLRLRHQLDRAGDAGGHAQEAGVHDACSAWPPTRSTTTTAISRSCPPARTPRSTGRAASSS